jgi:AraC-like DNA-binding protein/quercetin dioxygenase-like cupin family protein
MPAPRRKPEWEDAYSLIDPHVNASAVHVWGFDESFPIDVRHFILRREADIRMNRHAYFELLYLVSGELVYDVAGERHPMRAGDLFVMGGRPHRLSHYGRASIRCVVLYFQPEFIRSQDPTGEEAQFLTPFLVQGPRFPHVVKGGTGIPAQARDLMERIHVEMPCLSPRSRLIARTYLKMILALLVKHYGQYCDSAPAPMRRQQGLDRLSAVFELIERRYAEEISVEDAAAAANMSKSHFMRFFKQVTGQPFVSHLNQFRIAKARQLLASTNRSIAQIGTDVGFSNQSYFGLVFRKITHVCPREYQAKVVESVQAAG